MIKEEGVNMKVKEAIKFLGELRNSFINIEKMMDDISSRRSWNKNVNGLREVILLLKEKEIKDNDPGN